MDMLRIENMVRNNQRSFQKHLESPSWQKFWDEICTQDKAKSLYEFSHLGRKDIELRISRQTKAVKAAHAIVKTMAVFYAFKIYQSA